MGFFDDESIVGFDANFDGRIDGLDDLYMQNLAATGDGYLSEEEAEQMGNDDELDPDLMDADEIREAIEMGELDPEDVDWDMVDMDEYVDDYSEISSKYSRSTYSSSTNSQSTYKPSVTYIPESTSSSSKMSTGEAAVYVISAFFVELVLIVLLDINIDDIPGVLLLILLVVFNFIIANVLQGIVEGIKGK